MENINKKVSRFTCSEEQKKNILEIAKKIKEMNIKELKKIPLHQPGSSMTQYKDGDLIRYSNGTINYVILNEKTGEKVPKIVTKIKELGYKMSPEKENKERYYAVLADNFLKGELQLNFIESSNFIGNDFFDSKIKKNIKKSPKKINFDE
jgi:hypothetical protein